MVSRPPASIEPILMNSSYTDLVTLVAPQDMVTFIIFANIEADMTGSLPV